MRDWIKDLKAIPSKNLVVFHKPMTTRYLTYASAAIEKIVDSGEALGWVEIGLQNGHQKFEVVVWTEPRGGNDFGWYSVFRIAYEPIAFVPQAATLFCFYNGKETGGDSRKGFKSKLKALSYMRLNFPEYREVDEHGFGNKRTS